MPLRIPFGAVILLLAILVGSCPPLSAEPALAPGKPFTGVLRLPDDGVMIFDFSLPPDAAGVVVRLTGTNAPLALRLHTPESLQEADPVGLGEVVNPYDFDKTLLASRYSTVELEPGEYHLEVAYESPDYPTVGGKATDEIPFTLELRLVPETAAVTLAAGATLTHALSVDNAGTAIVRVTVPEKSKTLRLDIGDSMGDLEMVAGTGKVPRTPHEAAHQALTSRTRETLVIPVAGVKEVIAVVYQPMVGEHAVPFTLVSSLSEAVPAALAAIPPLAEIPAATPALQKAMRASVEIFSEVGGGSGTLIGERGWVLTNWHVVTDPAGKDPSPAPVAIGVTLDLARPAVETFLAKVEKVDRVRDLALLRITSGYYGQPLPAGYRFPGVAPAYEACERLRVGELLSQVGFPSVGGAETRATISVTRSEVAGFVWHPHGRVIKVGGGIFPGNSGGGSYTEGGDLVGLPTAVVGGAEDGGAMGYVHPVTLLPDDWRELLKK